MTFFFFFFLLSNYLLILIGFREIVTSPVFFLIGNVIKTPKDLLETCRPEDDKSR